MQTKLMTQDYKPSLLDNQFPYISRMTTLEARAKKRKTNQISKSKFLTTYNLSLPNISSIINKYFHVIHSDDSLK